MLLLEAGGEPDANAAPDGWRLGKPADWGFTSEPGQSGGSKPLRRGRLLGGTSWLTRFAVRGAAADFDAWAARGNPGWAWADVLPAFRRLESDVDFGGEPWHGSDGPLPIARYPDLPRSDIHRAAIDALSESGFEAVADHNDGRAVGIGPMPMSVRGDRRVTTFGAYLSPGERPSTMTIRSNAEVDSVLLEGQRSVGVRMVDGTDVRAGIVILAAGTYGSPMILMRSGIGPANHLADIGIATAVDLNGVGANLADHPGIDFDSGLAGRRRSGPVLHSIGTFRSSRRARWPTRPDVLADRPRRSRPRVLPRPGAPQAGCPRARSGFDRHAPGIRRGSRSPPITEPADLERLAEGYRLAIEIANRPEIRGLEFGAIPPSAIRPNGPGSAHGRERLLDPACCGDLPDGPVAG